LEEGLDGKEGKSLLAWASIKIKRYIKNPLVLGAKSPTANAHLVKGVVTRKKQETIGGPPWFFSWTQRSVRKGTEREKRKGAGILAPRGSSGAEHWIRERDWAGGKSLAGRTCSPDSNGVPKRLMRKAA